MSKRYPGNFITGNPVALSQTSNNGIWDVTDVSAAVAAGTWQEPDGIYEIPRSLRFRQSASAYLEKTFSSAGNRRTWTYSFWFKRGNQSEGLWRFLYVGNGSNNETGIYLTGDRIQFEYYVAPTNYYVRTSRLLRDPSAWYHIVVVYDATNSMANDRMRIYVNGTRESDLNANVQPTQNFEMRVNEAASHLIGARTGGQNYFDGYLTEINHIDGQALDPSYFGYFDPITNIWQPKRYTGTYGTNGFYLPFSENQSLAQLGKNFGNASNYLIYSEQFNNAAWLKPAAPVAPTTSFDAIAAPNGAITADAVVFSGSTTHPAYQEYTVATPVGQSWTGSMYVKQATGTDFALQCTLFNGSGVLQDGYNFFTFDSATKITSSATNSFMSVGSQYIGNGWHRIWATNTNQSASAGTYIRVSIGQRSAPTAWSIYCWGAQLTLGTTLLPYTQTVASIINNDWTPTNISVTAGTTYDSMVDSPTNVFTSVNDTGGVVIGNYATLNPLTRPAGSGGAFTVGQGNLQCAMSYVGPDSTIAMSSGKWYWEVVVTGGLSSYNPRIGIVPTNHGTYSGTSVGDGVGTYGYTASNGNKGSGGTYSSYGASYAENDVIGVALDMDNGTITFYKNNVSQGVAYTGITGEYYASIGSGGSGGGLTVQFNFGQRPFAYAPPAGFKSLNTTNIQALGTSGVGNAAITPHKWFDINLYGGTGTPRTITNSGFQPDLVWTKVRNTTYSYNIADSVRGAGVRLSSDTTAVEGANVNGGVTSFTTSTNNGYTIDGGVEVNEAGRPYISWQWKASRTSGLNIITYTGNGTANRAISHNLGVTPGFQIVKARSGGNAGSSQWLIHHKDQATGHTHYFSSSLAADSGSSQWGSTAATSSNFYVGFQAGATGSNENNTLYVAYIFAEVPGFSKFGSYSGNSSADGPFLYCGFRPKIVIIRSTTAAREWNVWDTARGLFNLSNTSQLNLGDAHAEYTTSGYNDVVDFLSNGFKLRSAVSPNYNQGETYIWAAFAESPFGLNNRAR